MLVRVRLQQVFDNPAGFRAAEFTWLSSTQLADECVLIPAEPLGFALEFANLRSACRARIRRWGRN